MINKRVTENWEIIILEEMGVVHIDLDMDKLHPDIWKQNKN